MGMDLVSAVVDHGGGWLILLSVGWIGLWTGLFYVFCAMEPWFLRRFPKSSKPHENDRYWIAWHANATVHSLLVAAINFPACVLLIFAPDDIKFAYTDELALCSASPDVPHFRALSAWTATTSLVAMSGLAFTCYTLVDMCLACRHGLSTADYLVHHGTFVIAGSLIRSHCMMPLSASVLMAMEATTPFLNYLLFFRHRGEGYMTAVQICGVLFVVLFVLLRIGLNSYGVAILWYLREDAVPPSMHGFPFWFLLAAITLGWLVQLFWAPKVIKTFCVGLSHLRRGGPGSGVEDCEASMENSEGELVSMADE